jgi:glutamate-ammonia-ligase adenylyltransferase
MHKAWTWEHQALTRAAFSAGDSDIGQRFEQIRQKVMQLPREPKALRMEVLQMRQKMREAHTASRGMVDIKQSRGGIIDVEFIVQYLVLLHAQHHPELAENIGNIALLRRLADLHIIPAQLAEEAAQAYLELRKHQHAMKLQGLGKLELPTQQVQSQVQAVQALWQAVME